MAGISWDLDPDKSVAEQREYDLIRYLCKTGEAFRGYIPQALGLTERFFLASHVFQPLRVDRRDKPGDIDLIIIPEGRPDATVVLECKVVPVVAIDDVVDGHYRLREQRGRNQYQSLKRGAEQLKALYGLGFHQTYQCVIIATDARNRWGYDIWFREAKEDVYEKIASLRNVEHVPEGCGLMTIELVQFSDKHIMYEGSIRPRMQQYAYQREQNDEITKRVQQLLEHPFDYLKADEPMIIYRPTMGYPEPTLHMYHLPGQTSLSHLEKV